AIPVHADADAVGAQHAPTSQAVAAAPAHDVALGADKLADVHRLDALAHLGDLAHELVPDHERQLQGRLSPVVPCVDVQVGSADAGAQHANQDLARARLRLGHV